MSRKSIRVVIAEDHALVREGTRQLLESDPLIEVVGEAEDGQRAVTLVEELHPDVLVLDLRLPVMTGIEVAQHLKASGSPTKTLVLSAYDDDEYVFAAMDAGASGYLLKTAHAEEVKEALHAIARGDVILQSGIAAKFIKGRPQDNNHLPPDSDLTPRELEILNLAALGLRNKEIAERLFLSQRTIEGHFSHVFDKLAVGSRTEAIVYAARRGWLIIPPLGQ